LGLDSHSRIVYQSESTFESVKVDLNRRFFGARIDAGGDVRRNSVGSIAQAVSNSTCSARFRQSVRGRVELQPEVSEGQSVSSSCWGEGVCSVNVVVENQSCVRDESRSDPLVSLQYEVHFQFVGASSVDAVDG